MNLKRWRCRSVVALVLPLVLVTLSACASFAPITPPVTQTATATAPAEPTAPSQEEGVAPAVEEAATDATSANAAGETATATLLLQLDAQRLVVRSVDFAPPTTGLALLEATGLPLTIAETSWGPAVCAVAEVGCPPEDCFCGGDIFWNYAYWDGAAWEGYPVGASQSTVNHDGALEGWRWGAWDEPTADPARGQAAQAALVYVAAQQQTDGSIGGASGSVEALMALGANRLDPALLRAEQGGASLLAYVVENAPVYSEGGAAAAGKLAVALTAAQACLPAQALTPADYLDPDTGSLATDAGPLAWAILGSLALEQETPATAIAALLDLALPDGGWEWSPGWGADTNTTALALQALAAAGVAADEPAVGAALQYLASAQTATGGFGYNLDEGGRSAGDANSTAYVVQALLAWQEDPTGPRWQQPEGDPITFLLALQGTEGALGWQTAYPDPNLLATLQAIPALLGQSFPIRQGALPACGE